MEITIDKMPIYRGSIWFTDKDQDAIITANELQAKFYSSLQAQHGQVFTNQIRPFCWVTGAGLTDSNSKHRGEYLGKTELQAHHIVPVDYVLETIKLRCTAEQITQYINPNNTNHPNDSFIQNIIGATFSMQNGVLISGAYHKILHRECGNDPKKLIEFMRIRCMYTYKKLKDPDIKIPSIVVNGFVRGKNLIIGDWAALMTERGLLPVNIEFINERALSPKNINNGILTYNPTFFDTLQELLGHAQSDNQS
jgi:hypothetical protein